VNEQPVVAGTELRAKLEAANGYSVKLCDETGKVIGVALTVEQIQRYEIERIKASLSKEELDRRAAEPGGYSMDDVFRLLERP
jgi:hypothetical protein